MAFTYEQLKGIVAAYVDEQKQANPSYTPTKEEITGMIVKIGMQKIIDTEYVDDLPEFDGEQLPLGTTIEEYFQDLIAPTDYTDQRSLANHYPSYRPASYSFELGRKVFTETRPLYTMQRACLSTDGFANLTALMYKRLNDSHVSFRYASKLQLLKNWAKKVDDAYTNAKTYAISTKYDVGEIVKTSGGEYAIVQNGITTSNNKSFATLLAEGTIAPLTAQETVTDVTDTESGEAFVKAVKLAVEKSQTMLNNGNNLSGAQNGKIPSLLLVVKQGVMPTIEVDVLAGAFHSDKVTIPARVKVVKDLGEGVVAMLIDPRGCKMHSNWEQVITEGPYHDTANVDTSLHTANTGYISPNAFVHVFKAD